MAAAMSSQSDVARSMDLDFIILDGSPNVTQSGIDILEKLSVQSVPIQYDVESLVNERDRLTEELTKNKECMRNTAQIVNDVREKQRRERDMSANLIKEANLRGERLTAEVDTLNTCLKATQEKLENEIAKNFQLQSKVDQYQEKEEQNRNKHPDFSDCDGSGDESEHSGDEFSFAIIDKKNKFYKQSLKQLTEENAKLRSDLENFEKMKKEYEVSNEQLEVAKITVADLQRLNEKLADDVQRRTCASTEESGRANELEDELESVKGRYKELRGKTEKLEKEAQGLSSDLETLHKENMSLKERLANSKPDQAHGLEGDLRSLQEMNDRILFDNNELKKRVLRLTADLGTISGDKRSLEEHLAANEEEMSRVWAQLQITQDKCTSLEQTLEEQKSINDRFKVDYDQILKTWQDFELQRPVILEAPDRRQEQIDAAALEAKDVQLLQLRNENRDLKRELDIARRQAASTQAPRTEAGASATVRPKQREFKCPLCPRICSDQTDLIQHASGCQGT